MTVTPRPQKRNTGHVMPSQQMRAISAEMAMKHLSLASVAKVARINYHTLSAMLNGRVTRPQHVPRILRALSTFPNP